MRLAWRIAAGPKRAPGRLEVARSNGMPAMTIAASRSLRSRPRKLGRVAKVGMLVMAPIWGGRDRLLREGTLTGRRAAVGKPAPFARGERGAPAGGFDAHRAPAAPPQPGRPGWRRRRPRSDPLQDHGDALADADAHRDQRIAPAAALQLARRGQCDARSRSAERMADGDGAAVRIDAAVVGRQFETAQTGQNLRGEGFVDLD